jgi:DNA polymerase (family 10)
MPVKNNDVAEMFNKTADLLELQGKNQYRVRAYRNAARTVNNLSQNISDMVKDDKDLTELSGIGKDLAGKIKKIVQCGYFDFLQQLEDEVPPELSEIMNIAGLGAKRVKKIYDELEVKNIEDLKKAAINKKIRNIEGFGLKTEEKILDGIKKVQKSNKRIKYAIAEQYAEPYINYLKKDKNIDKIEVAGSYRRKKETVGDIDILVTCKEGKEVTKRFTNYSDVQQVLSEGETRASVILHNNLQVDLRVVNEKSYGSALMYFTGSKTHNIAIRKIATKQNWKINEYGVFENNKRIAGKTEEEIYKLLDLPYIPPELRENRGEIEAAQNNKLPDLIEVKDIKGDLHTHTNLTDGHHSLEKMTQAAQKKGYQYIANSEHSKRLTVAGGLTAKQLLKQIKEIDKLNEKLNNFVVLKSIEVDILENGTLDLPDKILKELDIVIGSVHSKFNLSKKKQTERILKAMDNPYFNILAHPTGRLINKREPYEVDMEKIIAAAKERGCILELNAHPDRLDLNDAHCKLAKEIGVKFAISTDAHSIDDYDSIRFGVGQARRGWLEADDVVNTKSLEELRKIIKRK